MRSFTNANLSVFAIDHQDRADVFGIAGMLRGVLLRCLRIYPASPCLATAAKHGLSHHPGQMRPPHTVKPMTAVFGRRVWRSEQSRLFAFSS